MVKRGHRQSPLRGADERARVFRSAPDLGVSIIRPDPFGKGGKVLATFKTDAKAADLAKGLLKNLADYKVEDREHDDHVREARKKGITWESEVPVTESGGKGRERKERQR